MSQPGSVQCIEGQHPEYVLVKEFGEIMVAQYPDYVGGCGMTTLGLVDSTLSPSEKAKFCIRLILKRELSAEVVIPSEYKGLKVFVEEGPEFIQDH